MLDCLDSYKSTSLDKLNLLNLKNRKDTRYIVTKEKALELLSNIDKEYKILEVDGDRVIGYETLYYDTFDFKLFNDHKENKSKTYNIRVRSYSTSRESYIDIKESGKGKVVNKTISPYTAKSDLKRVIQGATPYSFFRLDEKITVHFNRFTFVDYKNKEKFTIDLDLGFTTNNSFESLAELSIIEVKSCKLFYRSRIKKMLRKHKIKPCNISKYCLGVSLMYPDKVYHKSFSLFYNLSGRPKKRLGFM